MKICIAGAGAMGGRIGYRLAHSGEDVYFIDAWESNVAAIRKDGLKVEDNGEKHNVDIPIYFHDEIVPNGLTADLVIVLVKAMQLEETLVDIKPLLGENTYVLCLLNGIGHEKVIERHVPKVRILLGNTMWTAGMDGPGSIKLIGTGNIDLKCLGEEGRQTALEVVDVLSKAGLFARFSDDVPYMIYKKACVNGAVNGLCTLLECNISTFGKTSQAEDIIRAIVKEFVAVAAKEGISLDQEEVSQNIIKTFDPSGIGLHFPSMYQDLIRNNRPTEIDYINGAVVEKGIQYGIPTPYCALVTQLVHCKEEIRLSK